MKEWDLHFERPSLAAGFGGKGYGGAAPKLLSRSLETLKILELEDHESNKS